MINLHEAIYALNPSVKYICDDVAYDINNQEVTYDKNQAQAKLEELQVNELSEKENKATAKTSALAKLAALGLTQDEVKAIIG